jgi:hypothetical protein
MYTCCRFTRVRGYSRRNRMAANTRAMPMSAADLTTGSYGLSPCQHQSGMVVMYGDMSVGDMIGIQCSNVMTFAAPWIATSAGSLSTTFIIVTV